MFKLSTIDLKYINEDKVMKRALTILAILLLPLSVWAMVPVTDSDLSDVSGQAGVNINADLTMNISIGTTAWGDSDGITGVYNPWATVSTGGYVGNTGFNITNLWIRARTDTSDIYNSYSTLMLKPITIDIATDPTTGHGVAGTTYVRFGLGALQISMDALQFEVARGSHAATNYIGVTPSLNQGMGIVSIGGLCIWINPWSYVDIYNGRVNNTTTAQGVTIGLNIIVDHVTLDYISWGDPDGLPGGYSSNQSPPPGFMWVSTSTAGYVGINNFQIGNNTSPAITITGAVSIDVLTDVSVWTYTALPPLIVYMNSAMRASGLNPTNQAQVAAFISSQGIIPWTPISQLLAAAGLSPYPVSIVHISFPTNLDLIANSMWADVQVASTYNLGGIVPGGGANSLVGELGDIYIGGFHLSILNGSWVDIWAH
jgi:hypothetical protein